MCFYYTEKLVFVHFNAVGNSIRGVHVQRTPPILSISGKQKFTVTIFVPTYSYLNDKC